MTGIVIGRNSLTFMQIDRSKNIDVSMCAGHHLYIHSFLPPLVVAEDTVSNDTQKQWTHL